MRVEVEVKNYRCFPSERPARLTLGRGFTGLIGLNNAGKSAALKLFYELRDVFGLLTQPNDDLRRLLVGGNHGTTFRDVRDSAEVFNNLNNRDLELSFRLIRGGEQDDAEFAEPGSADTPPQIDLAIQRPPYQMLTLRGVVRDTIGDDLDSTSWSGNVLRVRDQDVYDFSYWFAFFAALSSSIYLSPFRNAINAGTGSHYDVQVGGSFITEWDTYKSGPNKANNRAALELTSEIKRIFGFTQLDINASNDNTTLQIIIDDQSYRLDEVGGGITHFVIALAYAATRNPGFIFIDEPELNLHPSLQLDFLTTIARYSRVGIVFATHSLGLARAAADDIYTVRRLRPGESEIRPIETTPRYSEFLGELSLSGYQELGFKSVLLVEGPTDVKTFQRLLRLYGIEHQVVLLPLGGSSLIRASSEAELEEIKRITTSIAAVIDSERGAEGAALSAERQAFADTCSDAGIRCCVLERRVTENYLTNRAVKAALGPSYGALAPYDDLKRVEPSWGKNDNWRIAAEMTKADLVGTDLGAFLSSLVVEQ